MISSILFATLASLSAVRAAEFNVTVGGPGGVVAYNPPFVNANVGDIVTFIFQQKNHTVTQSTFASPCSPLQGGFDSGFVPVPDTNTNGPFQIAQLTVKDTNPVWVYCRQGNHCQQGMVFAVNPGDKFDAFKAAATGQSSGNSTASSSVVSSAPAATTTAASGVTFTSVSAPQPSSTSTSSTTNDHRVIVGNAGTLSFSPSNITAQPGDTITFEFHPKNHTVTQSSFGAPCVPLAQTSQNGQVGFDSGFMAVSANATTFPTYTIQVNDTAPIWVYCRQQGHCGQGMVFSANAIESGANNFEAFLERAKQQNGTSTTSSAARTAARVSMHLALATAAGGVLLGMLL